MADRTPFTREERELLIRLDERLRELREDIIKMNAQATVAITEVRQDMKSNYVTKAEFTPVRNSVYTTIGFIVTGFLGLIFKVITGKAG